MKIENYGKNYINKSLKKNANIHWSGNAKKIKELDSLQVVPINVTKKELNRIIKATYTPKFPLKVNIHGFNFFLKINDNGNFYFTEKEQKIIDEFEYWKKFSSLLHFSLKYYNLYIDNNQTIFHSTNIKKINEKLLSFLTINFHIFPKKIRKDLLKIIDHLNNWLFQWNNLKKQKKYKQNDKFIFESKIQFPKDSINNIKTYCEKN